MSDETDNAGLPSPSVATIDNMAALLLEWWGCMSTGEFPRNLLYRTESMLAAHGRLNTESQLDGLNRWPLPNGRSN